MTSALLCPWTSLKILLVAVEPLHFTRDPLSVLSPVVLSVCVRPPEEELINASLFSLDCQAHHIDSTGFVCEIGEQSSRLHYKSLSAPSWRCPPFNLLSFAIQGPGMPAAHLCVCVCVSGLVYVPVLAEYCVAGWEPYCSCPRQLWPH